MQDPELASDLIAATNENKRLSLELGSAQEQLQALQASTEEAAGEVQAAGGALSEQLQADKVPLPRPTLCLA